MDINIAEWTLKFTEKIKQTKYESFSVLLCDLERADTTQKEFLRKLLFDDHLSAKYWCDYCEYAFERFPERQAQLQRLVNKAISLPVEATNRENKHYTQLHLLSARLKTDTEAQKFFRTFVEKKDIGKCFATVFTHWAEVELRVVGPEAAIRILQMGLDSKAEPRHVLVTNIESLKFSSKLSSLGQQPVDDEIEFQSGASKTEGVALISDDDDTAKLSTLMNIMKQQPSQTDNSTSNSYVAEDAVPTTVVRARSSGVLAAAAAAALVRGPALKGLGKCTRVLAPSTQIDINIEIEQGENNEINSGKKKAAHLSSLNERIKRDSNPAQTQMQAALDVLPLPPAAQPDLLGTQIQSGNSIAEQLTTGLVAVVVPAKVLKDKFVDDRMLSFNPDTYRQKSKSGDAGTQPQQRRSTRTGGGGSGDAPLNAETGSKNSSAALSSLPKNKKQLVITDDDEAEEEVGRQTVQERKQSRGRRAQQNYPCDDRSTHTDTPPSIDNSRDAHEPASTKQRRAVRSGNGGSGSSRSRSGNRSSGGSASDDSEISFDVSSSSSSGFDSTTSVSDSGDATDTAVSSNSNTATASHDGKTTGSTTIEFKPHLRGVVSDNGSTGTSRTGSKRNQATVSLDDSLCDSTVVDPKATSALRKQLKASERTADRQLADTCATAKRDDDDGKGDRISSGSRGTKRSALAEATRVEPSSTASSATAAPKSVSTGASVASTVATAAAGSPPSKSLKQKKTSRVSFASASEASAGVEWLEVSHAIGGGGGNCRQHQQQQSEGNRGGVMVTTSVRQHQSHSNRLGDVGASSAGDLALKRLIVNGRSYVMLGLLGKGGSSSVHRVMSAGSGGAGQLYAFKRVEVRGNEDAESVLDCYANEIKLLQRLKGNPCIIELVDAEIDYEEMHISMIMEAGEVDLAKVLQQKQKKGADGGMDLNPFFTRMIWQEMLEAVDHIHQHHVVHGDLKPANFVFVKGHLKLIDFGIAKAFNSSDTTNIYRESQIGTVNYMAPEAIIPFSVMPETNHSHSHSEGSSSGGGSGDDNDSRHSNGNIRLGRRSDIWSLGCILYQMLYGRPPFAALNTIQKLSAIPNPAYTISYPPHVDQDGIASIRLCLVREPRLRAPIRDSDEMPGLLSHKYLCIQSPQHQQQHKLVEGTRSEEAPMAAQATGSLAVVTAPATGAGSVAAHTENAGAGSGLQLEDVEEAVELVIQALLANNNRTNADSKTKRRKSNSGDTISLLSETQMALLHEQILAKLLKTSNVGDSRKKVRTVVEPSRSSSTRQSTPAGAVAAASASAASVVAVSMAKLGISAVGGGTRRKRRASLVIGHDEEEDGVVIEMDVTGDRRVDKATEAGTDDDDEDTAAQPSHTASLDMSVMDATVELKPLVKKGALESPKTPDTPDTPEIPECIANKYKEILTGRSRRKSHILTSLWGDGKEGKNTAARTRSTDIRSDEIGSSSHSCRSNNAVSSSSSSSSSESFTLAASLRSESKSESSTVPIEAVSSSDVMPPAGSRAVQATALMKSIAQRSCTATVMNECMNSADKENASHLSSSTLNTSSSRSLRSAGAPLAEQTDNDANGSVNDIPGDHTSKTRKSGGLVTSSSSRPAASSGSKSSTTTAPRVIPTTLKDQILNPRAHLQAGRSHDRWTRKVKTPEKCDMRSIMDRKFAHMRKFLNEDDDDDDATETNEF